MKSQPVFPEAGAPHHAEDVGREPIGHRLLEIFAIAAVAFLGTVQLGRAVAAVLDMSKNGGLAPTVTCLIVGVPVAYLLADLLSGIVHWVFDNFGTSGTPFLGRSFVQPFREHHDAPTEITLHGFVETNGNTCIAVLLPLVGTSLVPLHEASCAVVLAVWVFTLTVIFVTWTNQFHKWAHDAASPRVARGLQRAGLILQPSHHERHHVPPYASHYCITSGWMNPILSMLSVLFVRSQRTGADDPNHASS